MRVIERVDPKIVRPSARRMRRETIVAQWEVGGAARLTIGTTMQRIAPGAVQSFDLGGLIVTVQVRDRIEEDIAI